MQANVPYMEHLGELFSQRKRVQKKSWQVEHLAIEMLMKVLSSWMLSNLFSRPVTYLDDDET